MPGNESQPLVRDIDCHPSAGCVAVRGPPDFRQCMGNGCTCDDCYSGVFRIDPRASTLTAQTILVSRKGEVWTHAAWSPDGTRVAVLQEPARILVLEAATGVEVQRIEGSSDVTNRVLMWPEANRIVTSFGTYETSGRRLGPGANGWAVSGERRVAPYDGQARFGPLALYEGQTIRTTIGPALSSTDAELARDAPYLGVRMYLDVQTDAAQRDEIIRIYDARDGKHVAELPTAWGRGPTFDFCVDGTMPFFDRAVTLQVARPPQFVPTPIPLGSARPTGSVRVLVAPPTGVASDCIALVALEQEKAAIVNVTRGEVVEQLPFTARYATLALDRFYAAPERILNRQGALVAELPRNVVRWSAGQDTVWLLDNTGMLTPWSLVNATAGVGRQVVRAVNANSTVRLPGHMNGPLYLMRGGNGEVVVEPGGPTPIQIVVSSVREGLVLYDGQRDNVIIVGAGIVVAHPQSALHALALEVTAP